MIFKNLYKYISFRLISFIAYIFTVIWLFYFCILMPYLIKSGGKFNYVLDTYPGLITFEDILFKTFLVYIFLIFLLLFCAKIEKKNVIDKKINIKKIYFVVFLIGLFLIFSPLYIIIVYILEDLISILLR